MPRPSRELQLHCPVLPTLALWESCRCPHGTLPAGTLLTQGQGLPQSHGALPAGVAGAPHEEVDACAGGFVPEGVLEPIHTAQLHSLRPLRSATKESHDALGVKSASSTMLSRFSSALRT